MPSAPGYSKTCEWCDKTFEAKKKSVRFCSKSCGTKFRLENSDLGEGICPHCGDLFKKKSSNQKMCGKTKCHTKAQVIKSYNYLNGNKDAYISLLLKKKERSKLTLDYILSLYDKQGGKCALSGKEMTFIKIPNSDKVHTNLSIDRIDSSKPYGEGNIQLVCAVTNLMKTTLTMSELVDWCKSIVNCLDG